MPRSNSSSDHPDDGAKAKYPCGICNGECKAGSIQCGICPKWYHLNCVKVPASVLPFFQTGKNKVEGLLWRCQSCQDNSNLTNVSHIEQAMVQVTQKMKEIENKMLEKLEILDNMQTDMQRQIDNLATSAELSATTVATAQNELNAVVNTVKEQNVKIEEQNKEIVNKIHEVADGVQTLDDDGEGQWREQIDRSNRKRLAKAARLAKQESNTLIIKPNEGQTTEDMYKVVKSTLKHVKIEKMRITNQKNIVLNLPDTEAIDEAKMHYNESTKSLKRENYNPKLESLMSQ